MKKLLGAGLCLAFVLFAGIGSSFAGEVDILLQKLVEKGVLTAGEAQQIGTETKEQVKSEIAQGKSSGSPEWAQRIKFKGDARIRYQNYRRKSDNLVNGQHYNKDTARLRLRLGTEAKVNDQIKVYAGLASGSDANSNSTNQTFTDDFAKKPIWIDYAYAEYTPFTWATFIGGRMKNPIWEPQDMLWDTDINPEGVAVKLNKTITPGFDTFLNGAYFLVQQQDTGASTIMLVGQPGFVNKLSDTVSLKTACALYYFQNIKGHKPTWPSSALGSDRFNGGSTGLQGYQWEYNAVSPSAELTIMDPFRPLHNGILDKYLPYLAVFGEYHRNLRAPYSENAYCGGVKLGQEKVDDWGKWQFKYNYVLLESQAWPDMFPDSDRYGGRTGKGP